MPWTVDDVEKHYGGLTPNQKKIWVHVANNSLATGDDDGLAIRKANSTVNKNKAKSEAVEKLLYLKASKLMEQVRLQEAASLLMEADPRPKVERNHQGLPVAPTRQQYAEYFSFMQASHIRAAVLSARERWAKAQEHLAKANQEAQADKGSTAKQLAARFAAAEVKALGFEVSAGQTVLKQKQAQAAVAKKKKDLKSDKRREKMHSAVHAVAGALTGGTPLGHWVGGHVANALFGRREGRH